MANFYGYNPNNQNMINQLMRQKENIDNMIQQYSQPQAPVQNIINTSTGLDFEAKILKDGEKPENIFIQRRTMFLDRNNKKVFVKEIDGNISESYDIIVPLDEKDKKIMELERKLKEANNREPIYVEPDYTERDRLREEVRELNEKIKELEEKPKETKTKKS